MSRSLLSSSVDWFYQFGGSHAQRASKQHKRQQTDVGFPSLHKTNVVSVHFGNFREFLLGQFAFNAQFAQPPAEECEGL